MPSQSSGAIADTSLRVPGRRCERGLPGRRRDRGDKKSPGARAFRCDGDRKNSPLWKTNPKQQLGYLESRTGRASIAPGQSSSFRRRIRRCRAHGQRRVAARPISNTRTNALKEHLGAGKKKPAVTVEQVIDGINAANTPEELLAAAEQAKNLNADDKAKAGSAYTARLHQLKAAANTIDQGTGEIYEPGEVPAIDPDDEFLKGLEQGQAQ